jgi:hypothetical protein
MNQYDDLVRELEALGRSLDSPESAGLVTAVLERVEVLPTPSPSRWQRWRHSVAELARTWRRVTTLVVVAVLVALAATPPVRAAVADWFGFAGVRIEQGPDRGDEAPPPPSADSTMSVAEAAELVGFTVLVPDELGKPGAVEISDDRVIVSMSWTTDAGPVRLDQFDGRLDFTIAKTSPGAEFVAVNGGDAIWFERPHEVVVLDEEDNPRTETARLAGQTLIWPMEDTTLRLEGDLTREEAVAIAESASPYDE